jgi:hypothetical protein
MSDPLSSLPDRAAIWRVVRHLEWLTQPEGPLYVWRGGDRLPDGSIQMPYVEYAREVEALVGDLYECGFIVPFDWAKEARQLEQLHENEQAMNSASLEVVVKLFTLHVRADRFNEGNLAHAFDRGWITQLLRRLMEIDQKTPEAP